MKYFAPGSLCSYSICCYIIISYLYNNQFNVKLYSIEGLKTSCSANFIKSYLIYNIQSNNVKCEIMKSSSNLEILTCFYQTSNSIKAYSYKIDTNNENYQFILKNLMNPLQLKLLEHHYQVIPLNLMHVLLMMIIIIDV